ncbi:hypothetical protein THAOC_11412, partial [Thalassiosira oceanica]
MGDSSPQTLHDNKRLGPDYSSEVALWRGEKADTYPL